MVTVDGNEPLLHHPGVHGRFPPLPHHFHRHHHPHPHPHPHVGFGWSAIDVRNSYDSTDSSASGDDDDEHGHEDVIVIDLTGNGNGNDGTGNATTSHGRGDNNTKANNNTYLRGVGINVSSSPDQSDTNSTRAPQSHDSTTTFGSTAPLMAFFAVGPNGAVGVPIRKQTDMDIAPTTESAKDTKGKEKKTTHSGKDGEKTEEVNSKKADDKITHSKIFTANPQSKENDSTKCPQTVSATTASSARPNTTRNKTFHVRTPAHHDETSTYATISFDVSGFTMDQLEIRIVVDDEKDRCKSFAAASNSNNNENNNNNNILLLKVSGKRQNSIGDEFVIDRKFVLKRDQLATSDIDKLPIEAKMSESDGILSIRVPKNEKKKKKNQAATTTN